MKTGSVEYKSSINLEKMNKDFKRLQELIIRAIGDDRKCPHCGKTFIPQDEISMELLIFYKKHLDKS